MISLLFDARPFESTFSGIAKTTLFLYQALYDYYSDCIGFTGMYLEKIYGNLPKFIRTTKAFIPIKKYSSVNIGIAMCLAKSKYIHFPLNGEIPVGMIPGKKISTIHDVLPLEIPRYFRNVKDEKHYRKKMQNNINRTDLIFTPSQYSKKRIHEEFIVNCPIIVQPWAGAVEVVKVSNQRIENNPPRKPYFLYAGGYDERKGISDLLKAVLLFEKKVNENVLVVFVGKKRKLNNETESLLEECRNRNLINELGYVSEQELAELYRNAIALCFLSKYEGFGLTPLEAMTFGCPVITTHYTSLPEVCGDAAFYVETDNPDEVAFAMEQMLNNEIRENFINKGYKRASSFSWKRSADIFITHIKDI